MKNPHVSVLMAVYNGELYLPDAIESILNQTFRDFEFIIVDDDSTDKSAEILAHYAAQDGRIVLLRNETNLGIGPTRNKGLAMARGVYIAVLDQDDVAAPVRLSKQVEFLEKHPEIGMLGTWATIIDESGQPLGVIPQPTSPALIQWLLLFGDCVIHSSVLMRRSLVQEVGGYSDQKELYREDYDLFSRLSFETQIANLPEPLVSYRTGDHRVSVKHRKSINAQMYLIMRVAICRMLGENVHLKEIMALRQTMYGHAPHDAQPVWCVAKLIRRLYDSYMESALVSKTEAKEVTVDAAYRLFLLATNNVRVSPRAFVCLTLSALRLDPSLPSRPTARKRLTRALYSLVTGGKIADQA
jgi:glycosyltransferase involved in cell wall biosynthesis